MVLMITLQALLNQYTLDGFPLNDSHDKPPNQKIQRRMRSQPPICSNTHMQHQTRIFHQYPTASTNSDLLAGLLLDSPKRITFWSAKLLRTVVEDVWLLT